jgi:hypothetical protein
MKKKYHTVCTGPNPIVAMILLKNCWVGVKQQSLTHSSNPIKKMIERRKMILTYRYMTSHFPGLVHV